MPKNLSKPRGVRVAQWIFTIAGLYGMVVMIAAGVSPGSLSGDTPQTHPEFYYGFVDVVLTWQVLFLLIATDPLRYRPIMPVAAIGEKGLFVVTMCVLMSTHRVSTNWIAPVATDAILGVAFLTAYRLTARDTVETTGT